VLAAVKEDIYALRLAADALRNDREFMLAAVQPRGMALCLALAPEALRQDRELLLAAVQENGMALCIAPEAIRQDREVVLAAVQQNGSALRYASAALRNDPLLRHLAQIASRGKRRWHHAKVWVKLYLSLWRCLELSARTHYDAQFVNGEPVLVGKHAIAAKRECGEALPCVT